MEFKISSISAWRRALSSRDWPGLREPTILLPQALHRVLSWLLQSLCLKAAGIYDKSNRNQKRKRQGVIDYNAEIPFEKKPPLGFYDVSDEDREVGLEQHDQFPMTIEEIEGKRRVVVEAQLRKQDIAKNKITKKLNIDVVAEPVRKRSKLMLPAPQISDNEFEEIAKMGYAGDLVVGENKFTAANYSWVTPATPRFDLTPSKGSVIRDELHLNKDNGKRDGAKLKQLKQAEQLRNNLKMGLTNLPKPKNEYQIVVQPVPEDNEEADFLIVPNENQTF